jgi:hypothetical protein
MPLEGDIQIQFGKMIPFFLWTYVIMWNGVVQFQRI